MPLAHVTRPSNTLFSSLNIFRTRQPENTSFKASIGHALRTSREDRLLAVAMNEQRPPTRRTPLGEATKRVNNTQHRDVPPMSKHSCLSHHKSLRQGGLVQDRSPGATSPLSQGDYYPMREFLGSPGSQGNPRLSAISKEYPNSNRNSQISTVSTNASDGKRIKSFIGPWKLGKTLGKGATARVRLARHAYTGQAAAIKIVQKKNAQLSQAGSLAALDQAEASMPEPGDGLRRMPVGIEREVAIMKLIQHPNIMKLYDIWENRTEMYVTESVLQISPV